MAWLDYYKTVKEQLASLLAGELQDGTALGDRPVTLDGEDVNATLLASEVHVGEVGGNSKVIDVTLSLNTAQYASGDVLAEAQEVADAMRIAAGTGVLYSVQVIDQDDQGGALDLVFFSSSASLGTENSAVSISDADAAKILGVISVGASDYVDLVGSQVASLKGSECGFVLEAGAASTSLWVGAISRDTKTYTAAGIVLRLGVLRD